MDLPQITVIVPVYKVEPYLRQCVDSILAQTFTDLELVLVDDGSPDSCGAICDEYAAKDPRVHVIHQENGGLSAARNAGIDWAMSNSDSEWLGFVDSDDWIHPEMYRVLYDAAVKSGLRISVCNYLETADRNKKIQIDDSPGQVWDGIDFFGSKYSVVATVAWNKIYKKDLFSQLRYPVGKIHEDEYLTYKLLYAAGKVIFTDKKLYYYFQNEDGITRRPYSIKHQDKLDAIEEQYRFFRKLGKEECCEKWIRKLLKLYVYHRKQLLRMNESKAADDISKRAWKFIMKEKIDTEQTMSDCEEYYRILFPKKNRAMKRYFNLKKNIREKTISELFEYYFNR